MSDARTIRIDPKDYRLDGRLMRRIWKLVKPYWTDKRHWKSWLLMAFGIGIGPVWAYYNFWIATVTAKQANELVSRNGSEWYALFWLVFGLGLGQWAYGVILAVLNKLMAMQWYRWLSIWMVQHYLEDRTYYDIAARDEIDNPDERIQNNVEPFVTAMIGLPLQILGTILSVITNGALLAISESNITVFVVIYSLASVVLQTVIYWPLIRRNFEMVAANADFRYGLLRVRDNAETIAFFRGEKMERQQVADRLDRVVKKRMSVYYYQTVTGIITYAMELLWTLGPLFFIYPLYFAGKMPFGTIALVTSAAATLNAALTSLNTYIPTLASVAPGVVRMAQIVERHEAIAAETERPSGHIILDHGDAIVLDDVCFETPGGEQRLAQNVSIRVDRGDSLIITGQTGVGKSSILRTMAGLWLRGSGRLTMPPPEETMFVPQKPYMMLGDLRAQLLYPHGRADMSDADLQAVLEQACLADLIAKSGGLTAQRDWGKLLSLGEQQRISFARILISRPSFVLLDESTSAVDVKTEAQLYRTLIDQGITFISVGHRETILRFHHRALRLTTNHGWDIIRADEIALTPAERLGNARRDGNVDGAVASPV